MTIKREDVDRWKFDFSDWRNCWCSIARALEILDATRALGDGLSPLVFTGRPGKPIDEKQLRRLLRKHKIAAVPHGFRSSFRDWAAYLNGDRSSQ